MKLAGRTDRRLLRPRREQPHHRAAERMMKSRRFMELTPRLRIMN
jgi:hypothetical protein